MASPFAVFASSFLSASESEWGRDVFRFLTSRHREGTELVLKVVVVPVVLPELVHCFLLSFEEKRIVVDHATTS